MNEKTIYGLSKYENECIMYRDGLEKVSPFLGANFGLVHSWVNELDYYEKCKWGYVKNVLFTVISYDKLKNYCICRIEAIL